MERRRMRILRPRVYHVGLMSNQKFAAIVLAAGKGTRMKSELPKVLHELGGRPLIQHALGAVAALGPARTIVVLAPGVDEVAASVAPADVAIQAAQLGTGDAVRATRSGLADALAP